MTELYITGVQAVLPSGFTFTMLDENTQLTKRGEFSLDITLDLRNKINAKIFKHINRKNSTNTITELDAKFVIDNEISLGKIIDIKNTDKTVTFQFIAGNSEFNYFFSEDKKIWDLDWGIETEIDSARAIASVTNPSYLNKFNCCSVKFSNLISNDLSWMGTDISQIMEINNIVMNPYLLYYINKLPELIGFTLENNILNSDLRAQMMYLPNRISSLNYADALPDMTIYEFIDAIEGFFNVTFVFNKENRTASIVSAEVDFEAKKVVKLDKVLDSYDRESDDTILRFDFDKMSYELDSFGFGSFLKLSDDIVNACEKIDYANLLFMKNMLSESDKDKMKIHTSLLSSQQYIFTNDPAVNMYRQKVSTTTGKLIRCNQFRSYESENSTKEFISGIKPISFEYVDKYSGGFSQANFPLQMPSINAELYILSTQGILSAVQESLKVIPRSSKIEIALYNGLVTIKGMSGALGGGLGYNNAPFPLSFADTYPFYWFPPMYINHESVNELIASFDSWITNYYNPVCNQTLRLVGTDGIFNTYHKNRLIDTSKKYTYKIPKKSIGINDILEYDGCRYLPISFEKSIDTKGVKKTIVGEFYKIRT